MPFGTLSRTHWLPAQFENGPLRSLSVSSALLGATNEKLHFLSSLREPQGPAANTNPTAALSAMFQDSLADGQGANILPHARC